MKVTNNSELIAGETVSIGVFETTDFFERRIPDLPTVFVIRYRSDQFGNVVGMLRGHKRVRKTLVSFRQDLSPTTTYDSIDAANVGWHLLQQQLARIGYSVNPTTSNEHSVYVLELRPKRAGEKRVYVGQTSRPVEIRIEQHLAGGRLASKCVHDNFVRRLETLEPARKFHSLFDAEAEETALGLALLAAGYRVCGPSGLPTDSDA